MLDHVGGPLGIGGYAGKKDEVFATWRAAIRELATCPNVCVKLGGLGMRINGLGFEEQAEPPSSDELAAAWKPYVDTCDRGCSAPTAACSRATSPSTRAATATASFWNACKKLARGRLGRREHRAVQRHGSRFYRLG